MSKDSKVHTPYACDCILLYFKNKIKKMYLDIEY